MSVLETVVKFPWAHFYLTQKSIAAGMGPLFRLSHVLVQVVLWGLKIFQHRQKSQVFCFCGFFCNDCWAFTVTEEEFKELEQDWFKIYLFSLKSLQVQGMGWFVLWFLAGTCFQYNPALSVRPYGLDCELRTFQTREQWMWIAPLDPDHIFPQQFISFQWMIPFWLSRRLLEALLSPSAFLTYFRCQNTFVAMSHCSVLPACAECFNGRTAWKMWGTSQNLRFFSSQ